MKKIGILTFHYSNNYGGVLQAYSLYKYIKDRGYEVEIINYIPENYKPKNIIRNLGIKKGHYIKQLTGRNLFNILSKVITKMKYSHHIIEKFNKFRIDNFALSQECYFENISLVLKDYDILIVGSDQVWNPSQRVSPIYFLDFPEISSHQLKVSYAADCTTEEFIGDERNITRALKNFDYISVRNTHTQDYVFKHLQFKPKIVCDPTLLCDFNFLKSSEIAYGDYILEYVLGEEIPGGNRVAISKLQR